MKMKINLATCISAILFITSNVVFAMNEDNSEIKTKQKIIAYVNQGENCSVAMIDLKTYQVIDTIPISFDKTGCMLESVVTPKRDLLYAIEANEHGVDQYVRVFDIKTHKLVNSILVSSRPIRMPLSNIIMKPDGSHVYVSSYGSSGNDTVWDIDTRTQNASIIRMGRRSSPGAMAISSDGNKLYVATRGENSISVIDTASNTIIGTMDGADGSKIILSRDGKTLYVNWGNILWSFDTVTNKKLWEKQLPVEGGLSIAISPDNQTLYTSPYYRTAKVPGFFAINLETLAVTKLSATTNSLWGVEINDDGKIIYIADYDAGEMLAMNVDTGEIKARVSGLGHPEAIYLY